jgi:hypothetical protein
MSSSNDYEVGALYKALSTSTLKKLEVEQLDGLKLQVFPEQVKRLRELQKSLRSRFGKKPDFKLILNAVLALSLVDDGAIAQWIADLYSKTQETISNGQDTKPKKSLTDLLREQAPKDDE